MTLKLTNSKKRKVKPLITYDRYFLFVPCTVALFLTELKHWSLLQLALKMFLDLLSSLVNISGML